MQWASMTEARADMSVARGERSEVKKHQIQKRT